MLLQPPLGHDQHGGSGVGDLAGDGCRQAPALHERLQLGHLLERGVAAEPLVDGGAVEREDLALEAALVGGLGGSPV